MNVKNVEKENGAAKVTIEIARDEFQTALDKAYAKIRKDIMIPGFRKGKAPRKFVERMYGSQVLDRKSTRLNSSHKHRSRMPSSA